MPSVNPEILRWARESAGLSLDDAALAVKLGDRRDLSGAQRLEALENGDEEPSRPLLRRMAEKYRRPLIAFYLKEPPPSGDRGEDFRRAPGAPAPEFDPELDALIRSVRARHELVKSLLEDEEAAALPFVGSSTLGDGASAVADSIRSTIGFELSEFRRARNVDEAFRYLRGCFEVRGIFVILVGNLGSYHSNISANTFRGYAISDPIAPFIVINDNDARAAWSFTACHEAAHLRIGQTGLSGSSHEAVVERFCNDVAGRLLLPRAELSELRELQAVPFEDALDRISTFASERNISRSMVGYQLYRAGGIDHTRYRHLRERLHADWLQSKKKAPDSTRGEGGPNFHVVRRHRLGPAMVSLAQRSVDGGALTPTKAAQLLGVKPVTVHTLLHSEPG